MNGYKIPLSLLKEKTYLADKYFSERFPTPTLEKTENPNFESSGCGVSMNATETEQSFNITDPSDSSKVLCEMIYSTEGIKFRYPNINMVNSVIDVGIGSNEKLDILSDSLTAMKNNFSLKYGGAYVITDEIGELFSICYGNGKFVAGAYEGNYCCYSTDGGNTWTKSVIDENATTAVWDICYGNNKFVAVADGYLMYSTNGINWTKSKDTDRYWKSVCYGNDKYVAVSDDGCITYSNDGITWNEETISNTPQWYSVCYGDGKFIAVSCDGIVGYSEDGIDWIPYSLQIDIAAWNVEYTEDKFIITCENTDSGYLMLYSLDGLNWSNLYDETVYGTVYSDNGKYLLGGFDGACKYSYDGILWKTVMDVPSDMSIHGICNIPGSDRFICVGSGILSVMIPDNYKKGTRSELAVTYNWTNAPEGFLLPPTETYIPGTNVTVDTYYDENCVYISDSGYYQFSGWDKTDFNITEDTTISGTWTSITELPENPVYIDGNLDNRMLKTVTYNINIPDDNITETVTVELPNDKKYISSISGDNSNISVNIPDVTPTPSLLKGSNYYYTFEGFTSDDVNVTSDS